MCDNNENTNENNNENTNENNNENTNVSMTVSDVPESGGAKYNVITDVVDSGAKTEHEMVNVSRQLLDNVVNLLDIIGARGAFKTNEMLAVGTIYSNLVSSISKKE